MNYLKILENEYKPAELAPQVKPDKSAGIDVTQWFYAAMESLLVKDQKGLGVDKIPTQVLPDNETPELLIAKNPDMSAATLFNLLKSKGYKVEKQEANAASSNVAQQREAAPPIAGNLSFRAKFSEANAVDDGIGPTKFSVILIREGMGNFGTAYYYTKEALMNAVPVFEGKKIYADHPTAEEDQIRPERSVRDILGYFENVRAVEAKDGCLELQAEVKLMADKPYEWARALMRNSVEYAKKFPDKDFVGLSINANGDAKEAAIDEILRSAPEGAKLKLSKALEAGITTVRVVSKIDEAISCDLVTEAGAGGRIIKMLEAENMNKEEMKKEAEKEIEKKEADKKEASPMDEKKEADGDAAPDHSDVAADKALILDMLKKLGLIGDGVSEEAAYCQTKEAIEAACSEGASKEEAMEMAGKAMKMAKIMHAQKQKKEAAKVEEAKKESDDKDADDKKEEKKKEETKESEILKLKGENAKLKESIGKIEMEKHLDKILRESGFKMEVTKAFRKAIGEPKSIKDIDEKFKVFSLGVRESVSSEADGYEFLGMSPEKSVMVESDKSSVDLSDC